MPQNRRQRRALVQMLQRIRKSSPVQLISLSKTKELPELLSKSGQVVRKAQELKITVTKRIYHPKLRNTNAYRA